MFVPKAELLVIALGITSISQAAPSRSVNPSYAPTRGQCPANIQLFRPANGLSKSEADWVYGRKRVVTNALETYLTQLALENFDVENYIACLRNSNYSHTPVMGFAISGGGYLSSLTGTGMLRALDSRLPAANAQKTGGLLQSMMYMSGQSGGSWPIMSFSINNFPTADEILDIWQPQINRNYAKKTTKFAATPEDIFTQVIPKLEAGFNLTFADYEGRVVSYEFVGGTLGGIDRTFSSVTNVQKFKNHQMPMPLVDISEVVPSDQTIFGLPIPAFNATIYDVSPFEFGNWYGPTTGYTPTKYLGTTLSNGVAANPKDCVTGFDNAGFITGLAASAWNFWYIEAKSHGALANFPKRSLKKRSIFFSLADLEEQAAAFMQYFKDSFTEFPFGVIPNPYAGLKSADKYKKTTKQLKLVDATEIGQGIPLWSHINPARESSFIIAWDGDGDTQYFWNNGTDMYNSYLAAKDAGVPFPVVPPATTFVNRGLNTHPVFFGCNPQLTTTKDLRSPIVLYMSNSPYSAYENYTFTQAAFAREQMYDIFENSFNIVTQGNGTLRKDWATCLGCAAIDRSLAKVGWERTQQCEKCMNEYCWDGKEDNRPVKMPFDPTLVLNPKLSFEEWNETHPF